MTQTSHGRWLWPLLLALLASAGCGWLPHTGKAVAAVPPPRVLHLSSNVVNLADPGGAAYLRLGLSLALSGPASGDPQVQSVAADTVLLQAGAETSADLLAPGGKQALKHLILKQLQQRLPSAGISDVYFDDFLIQQ